MNGTNRTGSFSATATAAGPVYIIGVAEADAMANFVCHHFVGPIGGIDIGGSATAGAQRKPGSRVAATGEAGCLS